MDQIIGPLTVALLAASLAVLVYIAAELRRAILHLERYLRPDGQGKGPGSQSHGRSPKAGVFDSAAGYAIYVYRGGSWELESDLSAPGCEPSPPTLAGSYEGQVIKKESSPTR